MVDVAPPGAAVQTGRQAPIKLVCFRLHGQEYAVDIAQVKETMVVKPITRVFLTPPWLAGVINLRGDIVAVLDLAQLIGLPPIEITEDSRIIICQYLSQHQVKVAGVVVDELAELRILDPAAIEPPPATVAASGLLVGVATVDKGAPLRVLHLGNLFESETLRVLSREES
jgi:purine-binding chemotaxis protein CheW